MWREHKKDHFMYTVGLDFSIMFSLQRLALPWLLCSVPFVSSKGLGHSYRFLGVLFCLSLLNTQH